MAHYRSRVVGDGNGGGGEREVAVWGYSPLQRWQPPPPVCCVFIRGCQLFCLLAAQRFDRAPPARFALAVNAATPHVCLSVCLSLCIALLLLPCYYYPLGQSDKQKPWICLLNFTTSRSLPIFSKFYTLWLFYRFVYLSWHVMVFTQGILKTNVLPFYELPYQIFIKKINKVANSWQFGASTFHFLSLDQPS